MSYNKFFLFITTFITIIIANAYPPPASAFKDITIVVNSCDHYSEIWPAFFTLMRKYWPELYKEDKDIPILLLANRKRYADPRITTINNHKQQSWSHDMQNALQHVHTKYILYMQDDYFLDRPVNIYRLKKLFTIMQQKEAAYMQLNWIPPDINKQYTDIPDIIIRPTTGKFRTSLQISFWQKDILQSLLKLGESPWNFEIEGSVRSQNIPQKFLAIVANFPISHVNAVDRGYIQKQALDLMKEHNIPYSAKNLWLYNTARFHKLNKFKLKCTLLWQKISCTCINSFIKNKS